VDGLVETVDGLEGIVVVGQAVEFLLLALGQVNLSAGHLLQVVPPYGLAVLPLLELGKQVAVHHMLLQDGVTEHLVSKNGNPKFHQEVGVRVVVVVDGLQVVSAVVGNPVEVVGVRVAAVVDGPQVVSAVAGSPVEVVGVQEVVVVDGLHVVEAAAGNLVEAVGTQGEAVVGNGEISLRNQLAVFVLICLKWQRLFNIVKFCK